MSQQPPYVPIPAYYLERERDDPINLADYIRVLWRRRFLILLGTLACGLTAFVVSMMIPPVSQTRATLILQPSQFSTELNPAPLSVATLKTMLESDSIADKLRSQLVEKKIIPPDTPIEQIKDMLSVETEKEPLIDLVVEANSPEKAEIAANTWAQVFVIENASLTRSGQQAALDFIESQFPVLRNALMDRQSELKKAQEDYERTLLRLDESWSSRIVDFGKETERLQKEHQKETERVRLEFIHRWKPDLLKAQLKIQEAKWTQFQDQLLETEIAVKTKRDTLTQIKKQIQSQPQYLVLSKALTDEVLWDKIESVQAELPEELNRLATTQIEYDTLVPKRDHL